MPIGFGAAIAGQNGIMSSSQGMSSLFGLSMSKKISGGYNNASNDVSKKLRSKK
jgi:hypothetical protein